MQQHTRADQKRLARPRQMIEFVPLFRKLRVCTKVIQRRDNSFIRISVLDFPPSHPRFLQDLLGDADGAE